MANAAHWGERIRDKSGDAVGNFLIWAGGAHAHVVRTRSPASLPFFVCIGSVVVVVSAIATAAGTLVAHLALGGREAQYLPGLLLWAAPYLCVALGALYGLLIFSLDRLLVATTPSLTELLGSGAQNQPATKAKWIPYAKIAVGVGGRLALAWFLAHQLSVLVGTALSRDEILKVESQAWVHAQVGQITTTKAAWDKDIAEARARINTALNSITALAQQAQNPKGSATFAQPTPQSLGLLRRQAEDADRLRREIARLTRLRPSTPDPDLRAANEASIKIHQHMLNNHAALSGAASAHQSIQHALAAREQSVADLKTKHWDTEIHAAKAALEDMSNLVARRDKWAAEQPTRDQLERDFHLCDDNGLVPGKSRRCGRADIGLFTLVDRFLVHHKTWAERAAAAGKTDAVTLLLRFLIVMEVLAVLLKLLADRGRYAQELEAWEKDTAHAQTARDAIAAQAQLALHSTQVVQDAKEAIRRTEDDARQAGEIHQSELLAAQVRCWETTSAYIQAIQTEAGRFKDVLKDPAVRPMARAMERNLDAQTNPSSVHTLLPPYETLPSADSLANNLKGSFGWSLVAGLAGFAASWGLHAVLEVPPQPAPTKFDVMLGALMAAILFVTTSPGFARSIRPAMWLGIVVLALGWTMTSLLNQANPAGLRVAQANQMLTSLFGKYGEPVILGAAAFLMLAFLRYFRSQFKQRRGQAAKD